MGGETKLSKTILDAVNLLPGVRMWRSNVGQRNRTNRDWKGRPDLVGYVGRYFIAIEVKTEARLKDRTSQTYKDQLEWRTRAGNDGAAVCVVSSVAEAIRAVNDCKQAGNASDNRSAKN